MVCHCIGARLFEHAFDRVSGAGNIAGSFQVRESGGEEDGEEDNDSDHNQQLYERKTGGQPPSPNSSGEPGRSQVRGQRRARVLTCVPVDHGSLPGKNVA